jgi:hypothetical protein
LCVVGTLSWRLAFARGAATLPQLEKGTSAGVKRNRINVTSFICTVAR